MINYLITVFSDKRFSIRHHILISIRLPQVPFLAYFGRQVPDHLLAAQAIMAHTGRIDIGDSAFVVRYKDLGKTVFQNGQKIFFWQRQQIVFIFVRIIFKKVHFIRSLLFEILMQHFEKRQGDNHIQHADRQCENNGKGLYLLE